MNETTARVGLGFGLPITALLIGLVPYVLWRDELPDRLASHFSGSTPDDSMTHAGFALATGVMGIVGVVMLIGLAVYRSPVPRIAAFTGGFLGGFLPGLSAGIFGATVVSHRGLERWQDAGASGLMVLASIVCAATLGALGARLAAVLPIAEPASENRQVPQSLDLTPSERAVWSRTLHNRYFLWGGLAMLVLGFVVGAATRWWIVLPCVVTGLAFLAFARLKVVADKSGLHVTYGVLPWPRTKVSVDRIDAASVIDVRPMEWGGWGYRGSLKLMRQAAVVLRGGPGIRIDLDDGRVFVVTIDDPETPVALLNAEVDRLAV